ncbi:MAG TPA: hypothetical protein VHW69_03995 [Rhizomicrobium sp.]|jgi:hypothetical protein|nr:hypothetical protein [Rhizomicrobium sp.]
MALSDVKTMALGLSTKQGQIDIFGAIEMLGGLQYHYQQFLRIRERKLSGAFPLDAPDERFEAVAYINRIGQFRYFADSNFCEQIIGRSALLEIPALEKLLPFRHKYTAHRARDKPRDRHEVDDPHGDYALGRLAALYCVSEGRVLTDHSIRLNSPRLALYRESYVLFELYLEDDRITFNLELEHETMMVEASGFVRNVIEKATRLPKE